MVAEEYFDRSRLFRRLKSGPHGQFVELYAARLVKDGLARHGTWRCLNLVGDLLSWITRSRSKLTNLDERMVERYLKHRARKQSIQPGDRAALKRLLSVLRGADVIAPAAVPPISPQDQIFEEFGDYLQRERGLASRTIIRHLPVIRRFLREVCPAGASDLGKISQEDVTRYIERHARDWSADSGKAMCWSLRAFLRYLHHRGLSPLALAGCVPSIRRWKLASLPTYLSAAQVQQILDRCDRTMALGRRDYAILMMLAKLGLRANEVATLTLDDIDWRSGEMFIPAKGRQRARMPMPVDVGAAVVAYLRDGRPISSCRRLFLRTLAPHVGFASGCAITMVAKTALERAGIRGHAHQGAHIFRHSLATELLRSGATLSEIGQLLRHESLDTTRIYAKVDIEALRTLSLPWPGGVQ
ncbi:MAG: site-specific integrase [Acidibrevibacterium sp.]|jgi:site-specific recombinase XerD|uniref:site-specific integrase n=1 Tax=Acidibrevibacterium fodinaquatile TaxID=1969806 RepID=UPI000E0D8983|nr:site-specific integrase [Acidibrevibacterium fodinaquatile]MCA7118390.1 site-specific integrase [Acidibrevibacterium fodinaquatile]MDA8248396.1 site-specific integrase [Rhodospirillales bacterium]